MDQKRVMICDDQERFIEEFSEYHDKHYDIHKVEDIGDLIKRIKDLKKIPDLLLLDLYHPKDGKKVPEGIEKKAEDSLKDLDVQIEKTNKAVLNAWEPLGLDILINLRMEFSPKELPIVIYTQKGLSLLSDSQISIVDEQNAHWLLKKRGSRYTKFRIDRIINKEKSIKIVSFIYRWSLVATSLLIGFFLSVNTVENKGWGLVILTELSIVLVNYLFDLGIKRTLYGKQNCL